MAVDRNQRVIYFNQLQLDDPDADLTMEEAFEDKA